MGAPEQDEYKYYKNINYLKIAWTLPVNRLQGELGMDAVWKNDRPTVLLHPNNDQNKITNDQGLGIRD